MAYILFAVDDEPNGLPVVECVADFFARQGHRSEVLTDGAPAWKRLQEACPDILVCDVMLPNRDGFELVRELKRRRTDRAGAILLVSVDAEAGWYFTYGVAVFREVDALIVKPYSGDLRKLAPGRPLNYHEQLIVSVGQQLYRLGPAGG